MATAVVTITQTDEGDLFVDATCADDSDVTLTEALGMMELAKAILIEQAE